MPNSPHLEVAAPDHATIVKGEHRFELRGSEAARIIHWHQHMATHGEAWAATYLMGVLDGMRYSVVEWTAKLIRETKGE